MDRHIPLPLAAGLAVLLAGVLGGMVWWRTSQTGDGNAAYSRAVTKLETTPAFTQRMQQENAQNASGLATGERSAAFQAAQVSR